MDAGNDEKYAPASVESFGFSIGIGLRVVLLAFTFELDAATYCVDYDGADWETGWHFLNDWVQDASEDGFLGVTIRPPQSTEQKLYAPEDNAEPELGTLAYDPTDETVPFQLSGYGSSVDAANLSTAVLPGGDYKVIRAGERDFIVYTVSRSEAGIAGEDVPQLVMSELKRVNTAADGQTPAYKYGLANPTGASGAGVPLYLVLDPDGTGDLDFDVWVEEGSDGTSGAAAYTIHSTWVSYASAAQTEPTKPGSTPYGGMNADNYKTIPAPSAPAESAYYTATGVTLYYGGVRPAAPGGTGAVPRKPVRAPGRNIPSRRAMPRLRRRRAPIRPRRAPMRRTGTPIRHGMPTTCPWTATTPTSRTG